MSVFKYRETGFMLVYAMSHIISPNDLWQNLHILKNVNMAIFTFFLNGFIVLNMAARKM